MSSNGDNPLPTSPDHWWRAIKRRGSSRPSRIIDPETTHEPNGRNQGFDVLVRDLALQAAEERDPLTAVRILLTFAGRISLTVGEASLNMQSRAVYEAITDGANVIVGHARGWPIVSIMGILSDGRTTLTGPEASGSLQSAPVDRCVPPFIPLSWTETAVALYERKLDDNAVADAECRALVTRWLASISVHELGDILDLLHSVGAHAAPLQLYVEDQVFSNFRENNLTGKALLPTSPQSRINQLGSTPLDDWSREEATLVFCARLLLRAEGPQGLEEFNGNQLTPTSVSRRFAEKYDAYRKADAITEDLACFASSQHPAAFANDECANALAQGHRAMSSRLQGYRHIFGVNLHKRVQWMERTSFSQDHVLNAVAETFREKWGLSFDGADGYRRLLRKWIPVVVSGEVEPTEAAFSNAFEELIHDIARITTEYCAADIGMSRGMRSLRALIDAFDAERWEEIVGWELPHYYCCVVPSQEFAESSSGSEGELADILWAIASRMQYNSWHFLPANLPMTKCVTERDYFYPPTIPDLAEWSDQHHRGHVASGVRHSIRAPSSVRIRDREWAGFVDVRLLRRTGAPFGVKELATAVNASRMVADAVESLALHLESCDNILQVVAFGPDWYASQATGSWGPQSVAVCGGNLRVSSISNRAKGISESPTLAANSKPKGPPGSG